MRIGLTAAVLVLASVSLALAKDSPNYDKGVLLSMDSSSCGLTEKASKQHSSTEEVLCQEYIVQGDRLTYRIRPTDTKHRNLLPVGDTIQYRIHKDKMYVLEGDGTKEREYSVISMQMRSEGIADAKK
jgi:hypothetical protein